MSKNGLASYQRPANYVSLTHMPTPKSESVVNFPAQTGGLNIYSPDYELKTNESPDMLNMFWKDGALCSRPGRRWLYDTDTNGTGYACYEELFHDNLFVHVGTKLYYGEPGDNMTLTELCDLSAAGYHYGTYAASRGTFFRYGENLYYKARGVYIQISYTGGGFTATSLVTAPYVPVTVINADWSTGAGDRYQPVNRLGSKKTIWYNAGTSETIQKFSGNGSTTSFTITAANFVYVSDVTVNGYSVGNWTVSGTTLTFYTAPASGTNNIVVKCQCAVKTYQLPEIATSIDAVTVGGSATSAYTYNSSTGVITFTSAPPVTVPATVNTITVTYTVDNHDAIQSLMDCPYAAVFGGTQNICIVLGGCTAQPNAYFWNGSNLVMDASYFPMEQYNLAGDSTEQITGFGVQQSFLVIFKERSMGRAQISFPAVTVGGIERTYIEMDYTPINDHIGCDLPWTIQLIENNLVFCSTTDGALRISDSSAAYENNIMEISRKVNGSEQRPGLLWALRSTGYPLSSFDDGTRYWICARGTAWCWDYKVSTWQDPSWFPVSPLLPVAFFHWGEEYGYLNNDGRIALFQQEFTDFGDENGFERRYRFATQIMGGYDRLKDVTRLILALRNDAGINARLWYWHDYGIREDQTPLVFKRVIALVPRNLSFRNLAGGAGGSYIAQTFVRRPGQRHVRHFTFELKSSEPKTDVPILMAQMFFKYQGRDR